MTRRSYVTPVTASDAAIRRAFKVGETAFLLGLSYDVTLALVTSGEIGSRKVGKYHLVPTEEIDRYLKPAIKTPEPEVKPKRRSA